jgi:hypothetical protein
MSIQKIKAHFLKLEYTVSVRKATDAFIKGKHVIECELDVDTFRFMNLVAYYFGGAPKKHWANAFIVCVDDFSEDGHGITDICRKCGCTEMDACYTYLTGSCYWVRPDLCSACATEAELSEATTEMRNFFDNE